MKNPQFQILNLKSLWLIRHGESIGNVARHEAEKCNALQIETPHREPDVPLSELGKEQAKRLGKWFAAQTEKPTIIYTSPYIRAMETTQILAESAGFERNDITIKLDERLRERELGVFDCLTKDGAMLKYPDLCGLRERWGKFYFRPPGGESWADVVLRLRSFIETNLSKLNNENVLIVTHEVVVRCFRYILEHLNEPEILAIDAASDVENGAVTSYEFDADRNKLTLKLDNYLP
ncbi:MAG TPA: histidine phosphatase family protein [Pyrinomonadaceae bacterium]|nr:histidine phosphatase family protein [Pyrinomonadaceae bacterium]